MPSELHPYFAAQFDNAAAEDLTADAERIVRRRRADLRLLMADVPRAPVRDVQNLLVAADPPVPVRLYHPDPGNGTPPLTVYVHGGGWVAGDLDTHDPICRELARVSGNAILAVEYRLAPEHPFPAAFEDTCAVLRWVSTGQPALAVDPTPGVAIVGESAGGNLALAAVLALRDDPRVFVRFQVLTHPALTANVDTPSHHVYGSGYGLTTEVVEFLWAQYAPGAEDRSSPFAQPLSADSLTGLPPTLVQLAEFDPLRSEGEELTTRLRRDGVPVTDTCYYGVPHGFQTSFHHVSVSADSLAEIGVALRRDKVERHRRTSQGDALSPG